MPDARPLEIPKRCRRRQRSDPLRHRMQLEPDDSFAAEAAAAKLFEYLTRAFQFDRGTDASSDRAVSEPAADGEVTIYGAGHRE